MTEAGPITQTMGRFLLAWILVSALAGLGTAFAVLELRAGPDAVNQAARALEATADALDGFGSLPIVGDSAEDASGAIADQSARVEEIAERSRSRIVLVAFVAGLLVLLLPTIPVYVSYHVVTGLERRIIALETAGG